MAGSSTAGATDYLTPDGQYRIDGSDMGLLGSGAHGVVRIAQHVQTMEYAAVKITPTSVVTSSCKEMMALSRLDNPHIVQLIGVQVDMHEQKVYVIMELCQGGELFDRIAECGGLDEADARRYFVQILSALHHCHQNRIYHRDLKPENILLDEEDNAKVADFGLAAVFKDIRSDASFLQFTKVGSVMYAAPEVLTSTASTGYDASCADMWSLGIILFSMLSGTLPFECAAASRCKRYAAVLEQGIQVMCPEQLSEHVSQLLSRLLNPDPRQRYTPEQALNCSWVRGAEATTLANVALATRERAETSAARQSKRSWKVIFRLPQPEPQQQAQLPREPGPQSQERREPQPAEPQAPMGLPPQPGQEPRERHGQAAQQTAAQSPQLFVQSPRPVGELPAAKAAGAAAPAHLPGGDCNTADLGSRSQLKRAAETSEADAAQLLRQRVSDGGAVAVQGGCGAGNSTATRAPEPVLVGSSDDEDIIPRRGILFDHVAQRGWDSLPTGTEQLLRDLLVTLRSLGLQYTLMEQRCLTSDKLQLSINFSAEKVRDPISPPS